MKIKFKYCIEVDVATHISKLEGVAEITHPR